jgi:hypothetical protein
VKLHGRKSDGKVGAWGQEEQLGQLVGVGDEDGVGVALKTGEDVGPKILRHVSEGSIYGRRECESLR